MFYGIILAAALGIDHVETRTVAERAIRRLAKRPGMSDDGSGWRVCVK